MPTRQSALLYLASSLLVGNGFSSAIDSSSREPTIFDVEPGTRKSGKRYQDEVEIKANFEVDLGRKTINTEVEYLIASEMEVMTAEDGQGKECFSTIKKVRMDTTSGGQTVFCDSSTPERDGGLRSPSSRQCKKYYDMVGRSTHFYVDDGGAISDVEDVTPEKPLDENEMVSRFSPQENLQRTSRLLKFIPYHAVAPGDHWDTATELGDGMGFFTGTSSFMGYEVEADGIECAIIDTEGLLEVDVAVIASKVGRIGMGDRMFVGDIVLRSRMCWDNENGIARWSVTNESYVLSMDSPMGPVTVPVDERITTSTRVKA